MVSYYRHAFTKIVAVVLPCEGVHCVGPQRDLRGCPAQTLNYPSRNRTVKCARYVEYGNPGILAHGPSRILRLLDIVHYGSKLSIGNGIALPSRCSLQGPSDIRWELRVRYPQYPDDCVLHALGHSDHGNLIRCVYEKQHGFRGCKGSPRPSPRT